MFQKFLKYNAQMFEAQVYSFHVHIHVRTKLYFQKVHTKVKLLTELQIAPD